MMKLNFDASATDDVLSFFKKTTDDNNMIIEKDTKEAVLAPDGSEMKKDEFAGIKKGSEIFLKNDLVSMIRLSEDN